MTARWSDSYGEPGMLSLVLVVKSERVQMSARGLGSARAPLRTTVWSSREGGSERARGTCDKAAIYVSALCVRRGGAFDARVAPSDC